jgi:toxin ParE1/3/4
VKHVIRSAASDDIIRQFRYYLVGQDRPQVASRFLEAVQRTIDDIIRMPNGGTPKILSNEALAYLRSWPVQEFEDIRIYYVAKEGLVRVLRVLHGKRDINRILEKERADDESSH